MTVQRYIVLNQNKEIINVVAWDGDTSKWTPEAAYGPGHTVQLAKPEDEIYIPQTKELSK